MGLLGAVHQISGFDHAQILGIITGAADNAQVVSVPADTKRQHRKAAVGAAAEPSSLE